MSFVSATYEVARKEFLQLLRTKRLLGVGIALVLTMALLTVVVPVSFLGVDGVRDLFGAEASIPNAVLLFFLSGFLLLSGYFFIQLLPLLLTSDAVCSEWQSRTIFLLLSKPVSREAFVVGKFVGIAGTVAVFVAALLVLDYALVSMLFGAPDAAAVGDFLLATGVIVLGVLAFSAVALFFSTLTRSSVAAMLLAIVSWIILFPLLANLDFLIAMARFGLDAFTMSAEEAGTGWSQYLSPGETMRSASAVLVPDESGGLGGLFGGGGDVNVAASVGALLAHTAFFVAMSLLVVRRRNFE